MTERLSSLGLGAIAGGDGDPVRALERAAAVDRLLADRAAALTAAGRPAPVPVGEGASLVMLEGAAGRDRLLPENGAFHLRRSGERFSLAELGRLAEQSPERLSPNVLLRPVIEAALLPTVAYVGGPGELAYFHVNQEQFSPEVGIPLAMVRSRSDGSDRTQVRPEAFRIGDALWAQDGSLAVILGNCCGGPWQVLLALSDGSPLQVLIEDANAVRDLAWGP